MRVIYRIIFLFLFIEYYSFCQINPNLNGRNNWEIFTEKVPVSGGVKIGILAVESDTKIHPNKFYVKIPNKNTQTSICVSIRSIDGRYKASDIFYDIQNLDGGIYEFLLPTKYSNQLKKYSSKEITILTKMGNSCEDNNFIFLLSGWSKEDFTSSDFTIDLNSTKNTIIKFKDPITKEVKKIDCINYFNPNFAAYNCKCTIPVKNLDGINTFKIEQRVVSTTDGNISFIEETLKIRL